MIIDFFLHSMYIRWWWCCVLVELCCLGLSRAFPQKYECRTYLWHSLDSKACLQKHIYSHSKNHSYSIQNTLKFCSVVLLLLLEFYLHKFIYCMCRKLSDQKRKCKLFLLWSNHRISDTFDDFQNLSLSCGWQVYNKLL